MRKHHKGWVALFGAATIASSGLAGLPGAAADEKGTRALDWPVVSQSVSSYSLDGYEIGYLPEDLEGYGINASSITDRRGNRQSQISWTQGPDRMLARVAVLRSERFQSLEDLRSIRYGHLPEGSLHRMDRNEALEHESYLSQETGDLFWLERPGVAIAVHLQPDRWDSGELVRMAESVVPLESSPEKPAEEGAGEGAPAEEPAAEERGQDRPVPGEQATETEGAQEPAGPPAVGAAPVDEVADGTPVGVAGTAPVGRPADPRPSDAPQAPESPEASGAPESPAGQEESPAEEAPAEEGTQEGAPAEEAPAGQDEAPTGETSTGQGTPTEEGTQEGTPAEEVPTEEGAQHEGVRVPQVKECVIGRFVDFETGETDLVQAGMTPSSGEFVERVLAGEQLGAAELDRLLATVWHYGDEGDKTGAVSACAQDLSLTRAEVEEIIFDLSPLIAELVQEAEQYEAGSTRTVEPIGAEEWQELWDSVPWSFPGENS
ncbi:MULTISPECIES: hypothetical protein [Nocardiopsis]|uniref:Uncharacterized protein n=1 Tax=Nocardiopsis sinuspersici TaxID=501010 RepID=A0A1V3BWN8_9ACTN|nr:MULTISPECIES: hypothetical protein [Nocardiopsis]OOC52895.1 hypothetical protein NOSIN_02910 [Nocardiopsis sinuspersici]